MKRILCYGDSNTWGQTGNRTRYAHTMQWPSILQQSLGNEYLVIQEGLPGRTAGNVEQEKILYNGQASFEVAFCSASPVDVVIIALGSNDFKPRYSRAAQDIGDDLKWYGQAMADKSDWSHGKEPKLLYLTPANFTATDDFPADQQLRTDLIACMQSFPDPVLLLDDLEMSSDGVHYSKNTHAEVAKRVASKIKEMQI